ncbi:MAG: hypothetical protein CMP10_19985 [Zetaproteobacteria bacterium]|nr:hypothetical protein [Pseudobdellovibrionaceae bacterium]
MTATPLFPAEEELIHNQSTMYLAIFGRITCDQAISLTPQFMHWSDNVWLLNLAPCQSYWQKRAKNLNLTTTELIKQLITQLKGEDCWKVVLCQQPWQGVLMLAVMSHKNLDGFIDLNSRFGSNLFNHLSWEGWWHGLDQLIAHMRKISSPNVHLKTFFQQSRQMQKSMTKMGLQSPWELKDIATGLKRRFGSIISEAWHYAFQNKNLPHHDTSKIFAAWFPWQQYPLPQNTFCKRNLDFPLHDWPLMKQYLREDLNNLCLQPSLKKEERIIRLEWCLILHDMTSLTIPICFRHPHPLSAEAPHQETALLQAYYQFNQVTQKQYSQNHEECNPMPPVIAWKLIINEKITLSPNIFDLFQENNHDQKQLLQLENKLSLSLECYENSLDWLPEDSFREPNYQDNETIVNLKKMAYPSLEAMGKSRPLYLYDQPKPLKEPQNPGTFLERILDKWWQKSIHGQRDYYQLTDGQNRSFWAYHNQKGSWFVHGIFG